MWEFLFPPPRAGIDSLSLQTLALNLAIATALGTLTAVLYHLSTASRERSANKPFLATLILLSVLITLVTAMIGDSPARAFSLVGTLSLVRFRTVVEDTRDSAFVIYAVAVGMACALGYPVAPLLAAPIVLIVGVIFRSAPNERRRPALLLLRLVATNGPDAHLTEVITKHLGRHRLNGIATARGGAALDISYAIGIPSGDAALNLVNELTRLDGVQSVEIKEG